MALTVNAAVISIDNTTANALQAALNSAATGDIIEMAAGTYAESGNYLAFTGKELTVRAAEGAEVIIQTVCPVRLKEGAKAEFINIKFDCSTIGSYEQVIVAADDTENKRVVLTGCEFYGWAKNKAMIQATSSRRLASVEINNCYFHNCMKSVVFIENTNPSNLSITNSTFANITTDASSFYAAPIYSKAASGTILVDHCTFYDVLPMSLSYGTITTVTPTVVSNCIMVLSEGVDMCATNLPEGSFVKNTLTYNYNNWQEYGHYNTATKENCMWRNPVFADAANGDFTLCATDPARTAAIDGGAIGDPRWAPAVAPVEPLMKTVYCKMEQAWWTADNAAVAVYTWDDCGVQKAAWPGERMTAVEGENGLWSVELDVNKYKMCIFTRVNGEGDIADWGAKTQDLTIPTDDKDMFTIANTEGCWNSENCACDGTWSKFEPTPVGPVIDPTQPYTLTFNYFNNTGSDKSNAETTLAGLFAEASMAYLNAEAEGTVIDKVYLARKYKDKVTGDSVFSNIKFGTSSAIGELKFALKNMNVDSVIFRAAMYGDSEGGEGFSVNGTAFALSAGNKKFEDLKYVPAGEIAFLDIVQTKANKGRFYLTSITVYPKSGETPVEPTLANGYYLIGQNGWDVAALNENLLFAAAEAEGEYVLNVTLAEGDSIKVVAVENDAIVAWYPAQGDNYGVDAAHAGENKDVYFRPVYNADWAAFGGHIWTGENVVPVAVAKDFEIDMQTNVMGGTAAYLVAGETNEFLAEAPAEYNAYFEAQGHSNSHGYDQLIATVPVEAGNYKVTLGKCQYAYSADYTMAYVKTLDQTEVLASVKQNTTQQEEGGVCYHQDPTNNVVTMEFTVAEAQMVKILCAHYTPYIKFEKVTPAPAAPAYYLVGNFAGVAAWDAAPERQMIANAETEGEYYILGVTLAENDSLKVIKVEEGQETVWYPNGDNYVVDAAHAGEAKVIYFRPDGQGGADWYAGVIYIAANPAPFVCDWANIEFLGGPAEYANQFKVCKEGEYPGVVNIQQPGFATEMGIYMTFPSAAFGEISLPATAYDVQGAGMIFHLSAFTALETEVTVVVDNNPIVFTVYNAAYEPQPAQPEYYLAGNMTNWTVIAEDAYKFVANPEAEGEFMLTYTLVDTMAIKVVKVEGENQTWYPEAWDKAFIVGETYAGEKTIYFRPDGQGGEGWHEGVIYVAANAGPVVPTEAPVAAPAAPEYPIYMVKPVYSATYEADCNFGEWGSGTQYTQEEFGKKYVTNNNGYFGLEFTGMDCSNMEALHMDVWVAADASIRIVPIHGGTEVGVTAQLEGQKWNSINIALSEFAGVTNWTNVYQIKIDNASNLTFWVNNVYFYTTVVPTVDLEDGYYLIGRKGWTVYDIEATEKFVANAEAEGEYMLATTLVDGERFKVVAVANNAITAYYPDGMDNEYVVDIYHAGETTIYFRPDGQGGEGWYNGVIFVPKDENANPYTTWFAIGDTWNTETESNLVWDAENHKAYICINIDKNGQWRAQVKYQGPVAEEGKCYKVALKMKANHNISNVTVKYQDNVEMIYHNDIALQAGNEYIVEDIAAGIAGGNGVLVLDFGFAHAGDTIELYDLVVEEVECPGDPDFYLVGNMTNWQIVEEEQYLFVLNEAVTETAELMLNTILNEGDQFKVATPNLMGEEVWFPDGMDNNYVVDAAHAGPVTIYFRLTGGMEGWFAGCIYVATREPGAGVDNIDATVNAVKIVREGQVMIIRGEHTYTVMGQMIK